MSDRIVLTLPADASYRSVATLVLGGVGSRIELPYERMDDLQLALVSALEATHDGGDQVTLEIEAGPDGLRVALGPLRDESADDEGLRRVLSRLVDDVERERREGEAWIALTLAAPPAPGG